MKKAMQFIMYKLPSFWKGYTSAFDTSGQTLLLIPDLNTGFQRDAEALRGDWKRIGNDLRKTMDMVVREQ